jgi:hypothetical protein
MFLADSSLAQTVTVPYDFEDFTEISVSTVFNAVVTQGPGFVVEVTIDEEEAGSLDVTQTGPRLDIRLQPGDHDIETLEARVTLPILSRIDLDGVVKVALNGFNQAQLTVDVAGTSELRGDSLTINDLTASVSGTSQLDFGEIAPLSTATISVEGVSRATLNMNLNSSLTGSVSGVSKLFYYGTNVDVDVETDLTSSLTRLGDTQEVDEFSERLYFAQFADGGGLFSQITLFNPGQSEATADVIINDREGEPFPVDLNGQVTNGTTSVDVPAGGIVRLATDGLGTVTVGSVTVKSDVELDGVVLFGGSVGLAGVGSSQALENGFSAPIESNVALEVSTGIAIMSLESEAATVELQLYGTEGNLLASAELAIPADGQRAQFVSEIDWDNPVDLSDFLGVLKGNSATKTAATVIQTRPDQFATMPVNAN